MSNMMKKLTLVLQGHYAGATKKLGNVQFTNGKTVLYGVAGEVDSLARYLEKCYQARPEEKPTHGTSDLKKPVTQRSSESVSGDLRTNESRSTEATADIGTRTDGDDVRELRSVPSGDGHEDTGIPSAEDRFEATSHHKTDPVKLLDAMGQLDKNDEAHWTMTGKPRVDVVCKFYGSESLTRADLDAVWPDLVKSS